MGQVDEAFGDYLRQQQHSNSSPSGGSEGYLPGTNNSIFPGSGLEGKLFQSGILEQKTTVGIFDASVTDDFGKHYSKQQSQAITGYEVGSYKAMQPIEQGYNIDSIQANHGFSANQALQINEAKGQSR